MPTEPELPEWMARKAIELQLGRVLAVRERSLRDRRLFGRYTLLAVFEGGLLQGNPEKADALQGLAWDQVITYRRGAVDLIMNGVHQNTRHDHVFELADGESVSIVGLSTPLRASAVADLASIAGPLIAECQLPGFHATLARGGEIDFDVLTVSPTGLTQSTALFSRKTTTRTTRNTSTLPWGEVDGFNYHRGAMRIYKKGRRWPQWGYFSVSRLPNLDSFLYLVEEFVPAQGGRLSREGSGA